MGDNLEYFEELEKAGRTVKALEDRPAFPTLYSYYYELFVKLHRCRGVGMSGYLPITVESIASYCSQSVYDFDDVFDIITEVDEAYRKVISESMDTKNDGKSK